MGWLTKMTNEDKSLRLEYVCGVGRQHAFPSLLTCHVIYMDSSTSKLILRKLIVFPLNLLQFKNWRLYETPGTVMLICWINGWMKQWLQITIQNPFWPIPFHHIAGRQWGFILGKFWENKPSLPNIGTDYKWDNRIYPLDSYWETPVFRQVVLKTGVILPPGDIWHCLETFLVVSTERGCYWPSSE